MISFGRSNPFPFRLGGGDSTVDVLHQALLDAYAKGWDVEEDSAKNAEAYAQALAVTTIWIMNRRTANQALPMKMLEQLPVWEDATKLRPSPDEPPIVRRRRLAAKLRGTASNALYDIGQACSALHGRAFVDIQTVAPEDEFVYWPGGPALSDVGASAPGPPGFEWASNRCKLWIELDRSAINDLDFTTTTGELEKLLGDISPAWMTFDWHTGGEFLVDSSLIEEAPL